MATRHDERVPGVRALGHVTIGGATAWPSLVCAVAAALVGQGCGSDVPLRQEMPVIRDSAGVPITDNLDTFGEDALTWRVDSVPEMTIGADIQASSEHAFTYIAGALRLPDGGVVVADGGEDTVREYAPHGQYRAAWGRQGQGPGEFRDVSEIHKWRADSVAVWDMVANRLTVFDSEGRVGRTFTITEGRNLSLIGVLSGERLVFGRVTTFNLGVGAEAYGSGHRRERQVYEIRDGTGGAIALLGPYPHTEYFVRATSTSLSIGSIPYSRQVVAGIWRNLAVVGPNDTYELRAYAGDGSLRRVVRLARLPMETTDADRRAYVNDTREEDSQRADLPMASHLPMFDRVIGDEAGHLWVRDYDKPGNDPVAWTVFDSAGRKVARSEMPDDLEVWEIGEDYVLASQVDGLGVHSLVVLSLQRGGEG